MQKYSKYITLNKNSRGIYELDPFKGCYYGMLNSKNGCYGECYAARYAKTYGYDFKISVKRIFKNTNHINKIRKQLFNIDMPFVRLGVNCDPSEDWQHTLNIINLIYGIKPIVIITKHWTVLTNSQLKELALYNVCVNTSVSALDNKLQLTHRLNEYNRIKPYCKSILRVVSCDFNTNNITGMYLDCLQNILFKNENVLDNVLRFSLNNKLIKQHIINIKKKKFLSSKSYFSQKNNKTHTGSCNKCKDMCGIFYT